MHEIVDQLIGHAIAAWQRRWIAITAAWVAAVVGWIGVYNVPDRYQASARVYVDSQSLLKPLLAGLAVQPNINEQVSIMANTLLSRPNLEKVVRMSDMDLKLKDKGQMDSVVDEMEKQVTLKAAGYGDIYTISYENKNPEQAKKVVQSILTIFVENGLGNNRKNIANSQKFISDQVKEYETKLIDAESSLKDFKRQNIGILPGEIGQDYYAGLAATREKMNAAEISLKEAENKRDYLKRQMSGDDPSLLGDSTMISADPEIDARIQTLKQNLDNLRLKYTEKYPDIVAAKRLILELEQTKKEAAKNHKTTEGVSANPFYQQLNISLVQANADVSSLQARLKEYQRQYDWLKSEANRIPEVEAQYTQLTRNYEIYKKNYESLLAREESAKMSGDLQSKTDMVDFRVIDPPRVPGYPSSPNRKLLNSIVLLASLGIGIVAAFLLSQIRQTVNRQGDLKAITDLPFVGIITMIEGQEEVRRQRKELRLFLYVSVSLLLVYAAIMSVHLFRS